LRIAVPSAGGLRTRPATEVAGSIDEVRRRGLFIWIPAGGLGRRARAAPPAGPGCIPAGMRGRRARTALPVGPWTGADRFRCV